MAACRAIIEPLKQRICDAEEVAGKRGGAATGVPSPAAVKWRRLLATVLNQRSHKSLTPLMLACEHGHAGVAAYLLREGADPLATDFAHSRTCLHYAAVGGHADCLRLLCSDSALVTGPDGSSRPLRDVVVPDLQVQACRFIDQVGPVLRHWGRSLQGRQLPVGKLAGAAGPTCKCRACSVRPACCTPGASQHICMLRVEAMCCLPCHAACIWRADCAALCSGDGLPGGGAGAAARGGLHHGQIWWVLGAVAARRDGPMPSRQGRDHFGTRCHMQLPLH